MRYGWLRCVGMFGLFFSAAFIARATMWIGEKFGSTTMEAIVFHYQHALVGTPLSYMTSFALFTLDCVGLGLAAAFFYWFLKRSLPGTIPGTVLWCMGTLGLGWAIILFSSTLGVVPYLAGSYQKNTFIEEQYIAITPEMVEFPQNKRNVIVLSLESMEDTFMRENLFGTSLIPRLEKIQKNNPHCTLYEGKNLNWTVASLTGLLFGLPLSTPTQNQYKSSDNTFLPGAISLLELFEKNDYAIAFVLSGKVEFSGAKNLFTNHAPSADIRGWEYFESHNIPVRGEWGMRDKDLYGQAQGVLEDLGQKEQPFFMIIQTLDTHSYAISYGDYPKPYRDDRDSFIAADHMALEFLDWLKQQPFYENTTILIQGDHLYMRDKLGTVFLPKHRTIYNTFVNTTQKAMPTEREATMLDMGVSLLDAIGVKLPKKGFGLGRSIFSPEPTLVEAYGRVGLSERLSGQSEFYNTLFFNREPLKKTSSVMADGAGVRDDAGTGDGAGRKDSGKSVEYEE